MEDVCGGSCNDLLLNFIKLKNKPTHMHMKLCDIPPRTSAFKHPLWLECPLTTP